MDFQKFKKLPIMGILRGVKTDNLMPLIDAIIYAGLETVEITMNTQDAALLIKKTVQIASKNLIVGAGTVLNMDSLKTALDSGATFIVMPTFIPEVVTYCVKNNIPVFPGALTPQEAYNCWRQGATLVKVFPASLFGPKYFQYLKGPFADIGLIAVGGVRRENIVEYFKCGAEAVAVGQSVFNSTKINSGDFKQIKESLTSLIKEVKCGID